MKNCAVGIDIGGTNTVFGIVDEAGEILLESRIPTRSYDSVEQMLHSLAQTIREGLNRLSADTRVLGIGIGAPNGNYYRGTIEYAPNLKIEGVLNVVDLFHQYLDLPVVLTNDANAAAVGEMLFGSAQGMRDFILITIGTGLGSGIVSNGQLVYGYDGFAGEVGHSIVIQGGRLCTCGRHGCLETYVSARGLRMTVMNLLEESDASSPLRTIKPAQLAAMDVFRAASAGDTIAIAAFEETGRMLGFALANSVAHTNPEAIFLFGGIVNSGDYILEPTRRHLEANLLNIYRNKVKVFPSGLQGKNAAVLGAAALGFEAGRS